MMMTKSIRCTLLLLLVAATTNAQFTCSLAGSKSAADCTAMTDDDGSEHCVWCAIGRDTTTKAFGFCVSEVQAEAMEANIPALHCDRYSGDDDATPSNDDDQAPVPNDDTVPATDDAAPVDDTVPTTDDAPVDTDDTTPSTDDTTPSTDDAPAVDDDHSVPDDFWTCLLHKDAQSCAAADCTWCDTQGGFGLCMTGPAAASAAHSSWFTCRTEEVLENAVDRSATSCGRFAAADECRGNACEWCTLLDLTTVCLSQEQAELGRALGVSCDDVISQNKAEDPYDPSCALAYVMDPSQDACVAAKDQDDRFCQFCTLAGFDLCLTTEQATAGQALGIACTGQTIVRSTARIADPYDPSCALAFLPDATKDACVAAVDQDGQACEFCSLPGVADLCLTPEQAAMGEQLGITCDEAAKKKLQDDPYDPSCLLAYLQDASKDACLAAVDEDNLPCEFCSLQGSLDLCLTQEQAQMGEPLGITCDEQTALLQDNDPYDPSCALAFLQDATKDACVAAVDEDNQPCEFCSLQGVADLCLTQEQAQMGEPLGITCDAPRQKRLSLLDPYDPSCLAAYWTDPSEQECLATMDQSGVPCQYCSLPGSLVACLTVEQARVGMALGMQCTTEEVVTRVVTSHTKNPLVDTTCAMAYWKAPTPDACLAAVDANATPCEYCTLSGGVNVCLTADQALIGKPMGLDCGSDQKKDVALPDDFFACLQHYEAGDCRSSSCTWCNTEVGLGFCLAPAAAESTKPCSFFDCQFDATKEAQEVNDIYDPVCLAAGMMVDADAAPEVCRATNGLDDAPCVWCDAAGVFGVCVSSEQAAAAGSYLQCQAAAAATA